MKIQSTKTSFASLMEHLLLIIMGYVCATYSLQLITFPWHNLIFLAVSLLWMLCNRSVMSKKMFIKHCIVTVVLFICGAYMNVYITASLAGTWLYRLGKSKGLSKGWVLTQFGVIILLFEIIDLAILKHSIVETAFVELVYAFTGLVRTALGYGGKMGPDMVNYRLHLFSIMVTLPLVKKWNHHYILLPIVQFTMVLFAVMLYAKGSKSLGMTFVLATSSAIVLAMSQKECGHNLKKPLEFRNQSLGVNTARFMAALFMVILLIANYSYKYAGGYNSHSTKQRGQGKWQQGACSILFVNDYKEAEGAREDITSFETMSVNMTYDEYVQQASGARYGSLVYKLLPALGYKVDVKPFEAVESNDYGNYGVVVFIGLQHTLPVSHKQALFSAVGSGNTNLLVLGDHTDIYGVQGPFNDVLSGLGIKLNYDSAYPFGQWYRQVSYGKHPLNGLCWMRGIVSDIGISVGASLSVNNKTMVPLLMAYDGFSDQGTPNAPMYAGLGDQIYTPNETRGGQLLAVECPYGKGKVIAFGDTALLQNMSVVRNYAYIASLFEYISRPWHWIHSTWYNIVNLIGSVFVILLIVISLSWRYAVIYVLVILVSTVTGTTLKSEQQIIAQLNTDLVVIDDVHGQRFEKYDRERGVSEIMEILDRDQSSLVVVANAMSAIATGNVKALIMIAPEAGVSSREETAITNFLVAGGQMIYSGGYYESIACSNMLKKYGCDILPIPMGAGQNLSVLPVNYPSTVNLSESWRMRLTDEWESIVNCYGYPICALRNYGAGVICVISDSYAIQNMSLVNGSVISKKNYEFYKQLLRDINEK